MKGKDRMVQTKRQKQDRMAPIRNGEAITTRHQFEMVVRLSLPAVMAQFTSVIMSYIDASMVGALGAEKTAAIGLVTTTTWLFGSVCMALSTGFTVQAAQFLGAKKTEEARGVFRQGLMAIIAVGLLAAVIGAAVSGPLPGWLHGDTAIRADASAYLLIFACFLPFSGLNSLAGGMLQASGNMRVPGILNGLMCVLDVILNALLIFPGYDIRLGTVPLHIPAAGMGVAGAALGTALSEMIIALAMLWYAGVHDSQFRIRKGDSFRLSLPCQKKAFSLSLPIAFQNGMICGAFIVVTRVIAGLGTVAVAAHSLAVTSESLAYTPAFGIGTAAGALVGQSVGAARKDLAGQFARKSVITGMITVGILGVFMYFACPLVIGLMTPDPAVRSLGVQVLRIIILFEPVYAVSLISSGSFQGAGDTLVPSLMNLFSLWAVRLPLTIFAAGRYGLTGVWAAMCLEIIFRGGIFLVRLLRGKWLK